jgi:hypothetical protein
MATHGTDETMTDAAPALGHTGTTISGIAGARSTREKVAQPRQ